MLGNKNVDVEIARTKEQHGFENFNLASVPCEFQQLWYKLLSHSKTDIIKTRKSIPVMKT